MGKENNKLNLKARTKLRAKFMKKRIVLILVLLLVFIIGLFSLWQFGLYQRFSKETLSCGGDWSYNVHCPIGTYCQSLEQGPLAGGSSTGGSLSGGLCKPFLSPLLDIFYKPKKEKTTQNLSTSTPTEQQTTEKIISSEVTVEACKIKVNTTKGEFFLNTNFLEFGPQTRCYQFLLNRVSPSGKYVVFQDISGGVDSMLRVYSLEHNDTIQLDVFGTSEIFDISFLPNDKLIALYGYRGPDKEQYLKVFDLPGLFIAYPSNIDKQYKYFTNLAQYSKNITLPRIGKNYFSLTTTEGKLKIYGTGGVDTGVLKEYTFDELE